MTLGKVFLQGYKKNKNLHARFVDNGRHYSWRQLNEIIQFGGFIFKKSQAMTAIDNYARACADDTIWWPSLQGYSSVEMIL